MLTLAQLVSPSSLCCEVHLFKVSQCLSLTGGGEDRGKKRKRCGIWASHGWALVGELSSSNQVCNWHLPHMPALDHPWAWLCLL